MYNIITDTMNNYIKSPLNYTGGKYKLLPQIVPLFPQDINTFVDLFTGGANVVVNVDAKKHIANDFDSHVIGIYRLFTNLEADSIIEFVEKIICAYGLSLTNADGYNKLRTYYNNLEDKDSDLAHMFLFVLICYSFNHQFRFNKKGEFNMPFGKNRSQWNDTIKNNLISFLKAIDEKDIIFTNRSFDELKLEKLSEGDFIYCDPPYLITCATYNEKDGWNFDKEMGLYRLLDEADSRGIKFAMSNVLESKGKSNGWLIEWSKKYNVHHLDYGYGNCSYHTKDRTKKSDEVLITNY